MKTDTRKKFVVGNWKMHTTAFEAEQLAKRIVGGFDCADDVTVVLCPPFPYLAKVGEIIKGSSIALGAQNLYPESEGAFTGEVSPTMLLDLGCKYVILGHSERRLILGESNKFINQKVLAALTAGLNVIFCIGETLEQRQADQTEAVLDRQITEGLGGVSSDTLTRLSIGYEPIWAIGNQGNHATPEQAQEAHGTIRRRFGEMLGDAPAQSLVIQYGGSVKPDSAAALFSREGVDGGLVGGASLDADQFLSIVRAATGDPPFDRDTVEEQRPLLLSNGKRSECPPVPLRIYFIRHGETKWSLTGQHTGIDDIPLTAHGEDEARQLAPSLMSIHFTRVLTSTRQRARQTCELAGLGSLAETEDQLAEWNYGDYESRRSADIQKERPGWNLFVDGCPGGETPMQISDRADRLIDTLRTLNGNIALFSHGQFGCVLAARWIGLAVVDGQHFSIGPASVSILSYDPHHPNVPVIDHWNSECSGGSCSGI